MIITRYSKPWYKGVSKMNFFKKHTSDINKNIKEFNTVMTEFIQIFDQTVKEIIQTQKYKKIDEFIQHGNTSCFWHSIAVAYFSFRILKLFKIKCDKKSLMKGAILHDYFLYDWHDDNKPCKWHGFKHPQIALKNATKDFDLNHKEKDIIKRHMFPLTVIPPRYKEGVIVCIADKICAVYEIFKPNAYLKLKNIYS